MKSKIFLNWILWLMKWGMMMIVAVVNLLTFDLIIIIFKCAYFYKWILIDDRQKRNSRKKGETNLRFPRICSLFSGETTKTASFRSALRMMLFDWSKRILRNNLAVDTASKILFDWFLFIYLYFYNCT